MYFADSEKVIVLDNGLLPNRQQAIKWSNDEKGLWSYCSIRRRNE